VGRGPRRPHVIRPDEVDAWLADSVNKVVTYHRTTSAAAQDILEHGVESSRSRIGAYGQGFYTATSPVGQFGDTNLRVAVRTGSPLLGEIADIERVVDPLVFRLSGGTGRLTVPVASALRREFQELGYDSIIVRDAGGDGIDYVIALQGESVRVVLP
jgi:hypothetical protein